MTRKTTISVLVLFLFGILGSSNAQFLPSFALAGGMTAGWHFNPTKELNLQLKSAGFPVMSEDGFFTMGGSGFIDLPSGKSFIRIGGFGTGFTSKKTSQVNDTLKKDANYSMGLGGLSLEYVIPLNPVFDISFGSQFSTGTLKLELYQYGNDYGNYNSIFGELQSNSSTTAISRTFKTRFYTVQPQVGLGIMLRKFMYLKIDCGYQIGVQNNWRVDNDIKVNDFPKGIDAKGFVLNVGLNFGLFIRDN